MMVAAMSLRRVREGSAYGTATAPTLTGMGANLIAGATSHRIVRSGAGEDGIDASGCRQNRRPRSEPARNFHPRSQPQIRRYRRPRTADPRHSRQSSGSLGHNGAGKTTTIRLLTTLLEPSGGSAEVAGHDLATDLMRLRAAIGYLPENVRLYDNFTTVENLSFFARLSGLSSPADRVGETLAFLEIEDLANRRVGTFSKGMRQRVGLAQAILHRPKVLFLDEPTAGLDPMGVRKLRQIVVERTAPA